MKKIFALIIALCMVIALFAGCTTPAEPDATKAPDATEAPEVTDVPEVTDAPEPTEEATEAPTPEPTPEPFPDPYAIEILDWIDAAGQNSSFDTIFFDSETITDGGVQAWKADNDETVNGIERSIKTVSMRGWAGFDASDEECAMENIGYQIDNNPVVWTKTFEATEGPVKAAGGENAQRFKVTIPVSSLSGAGHELKVVALLKNGTVAYLNNDAGPFMLYYDGPEAAAAAIDGTIGEGEYNAQYTLDATTAKSWTNAEMGDKKVVYYLSLKEDGLYVGIDATNVAAGDTIQLNFNPGARIDDATGLFVSFVMGDEIKVLQHNHPTVLNPEFTDGMDVTASVEAKIVAKEGGYVAEIKLPVDFFKVTDVEKAAEFQYGKENLYFGMFGVIGGQGFTNQSVAPGSDWTCKGLLLHEYIAY